MYWICGTSTCLVTWLIFSWIIGFFLCTVFLMILGFSTSTVLTTCCTCVFTTCCVIFGTLMIFSCVWILGISARSS